MSVQKPAQSDLDETRLGDWLRANLTGFGRLASVTKFPGGQSNPTYRLEDGARAYVLRRKPFGAVLPSAHAVDREFKVLSGLHPSGFPVPKPYVLCEDADVIGSSFYIMDMVVGRTFWDGTLPELSPEQRRAAYEAMVATLARLHSIDPQKVGLGDFGPPADYFSRQVRRWTKQYVAAQTDDIAEMDKLMAWLPTTLPPQQGVSIIHGDYRIDNMIFAPDKPEVIAVLDWELSTLGDPLADFAHFAMNWVTSVGGQQRANIAGLDLDALNIPSLEEIKLQYCTLTRRETLPDLNWYFAYSLFRLAGIVQGIKKRFLDGNASSADAEAMSSRVRPLAEYAWDFARRAGAPA